MTTIILLNPMGTDVTPFINRNPLFPQLFNGELVAPGDTVYTIPYNNQPGANNITSGKVMFHNKVTSTPGPKKVVGYSEGCQIAAKWLNEEGASTPIPPSELEFVLMGNPNRKYGGFGYEETAFNAVAYIHGIPEDTDYSVFDYSNQYDPISDFPTDPIFRSAMHNFVNIGSGGTYLTDAFNQLVTIVTGPFKVAAWNAVAGLALEHLNYFDGSLRTNDPNTPTLVEGNITYYLRRSRPMPLIFMWYPFAAPLQKLQQDSYKRTAVESAYSRPFSFPPLPAIGGIQTPEEAERAWNVIQARRAMKERDRLKPAQIRLWDGDGLLRGEVAGWRDYDFEIVENDTGMATLELSLDHYLAKWVMDFKGRTKRNVLVTFDKQGYRWSGFMDNYKVVHTKENDAYLVITFKHDYEQAKHILVWANPFLRPEVQFPKLWVIFGPAKWALLVTLFVNIMRLETSLWTLPDNPLDIKSWVPFSFDTSTWRNIVKPFPFLMDNSNLTIIFARFKPIHDVWKKDLQDAQLTVTVRRYIKGEDPHPFSDLAGELNIDFVEELFSLVPLRHFVLVWDIVDKSGWGTETAFGGSLLTGLIRAVVNIAGDGTTEGIDIFSGDPTFPGEYYTPNFLGTSPRAPHVVYQDGLFNGITESEFTFFEATDTSFLTGGHSMPGVNEAFSAGVNMAGDFLTSIINTLISFAGSVGVGAGFFGAVTASVPSIDIPPLGGIMDAVAKILYEDTFMAFMEVPTLRASPNGLNIPFIDTNSGQSLGDLHYYEGWADGADRAFTLSAFMAVRAKIWATRARTVHTITVADAAPYIFGERGYGDFGIGDRIGTTFREFPVANTIFMERVSRAKHGWGKDGSRGWKFVVGWQEPQDPAFKALEQVKEVNQALSTFGIL